MRVGSACALAVAIVASGHSAAVAQSQLAVRTLEHGAWASAVAAMQVDPSWEGRAIHVVVEDTDGRRSPCGRYRLLLDPTGQRAFAKGRCDGRTAATELRLTDRAALFDRTDAIARPRTLRIWAFEVRRGAAEGRARQPVVPELRCSLAVRPYVVDLLSGRRARAAPDRFRMRPVGEGVSVAATVDGWVVRAGSTRIEYELIDRRSEAVVLRQRVRLVCSDETEETEETEPPGPGWHATIEGRDVLWLDSGRAYESAMPLRSRYPDRGSCGGADGTERWYAIRFETPRHLALAVWSEPDAALYVRECSIDGREVLCHDADRHLETIDAVFQPGTYFIAVDGGHGPGRHRLMARVEPAAAPDEP